MKIVRHRAILSQKFIDRRWQHKIKNLPTNIKMMVMKPYFGAPFCEIALQVLGIDHSRASSHFPESNQETSETDAPL